MSDSDNQYDSPQAPVIPEKNQVVGSLTATMLKYLKEASPWLKFIGVLGFISCGFIVLAAIIIIIISAVAASVLSEFGDIPIWLISPLYLAMGTLLFFPSLFTYNFGDKIRKFLFSNSEEDLEEAFKNNKSLWKFYGIMCIISLAITPVFIIITIVVAVAAASNLF